MAYIYKTILRYCPNLTLGHAEPIAVFPLVFSAQGLYNRGRIM